MEIGVQMGLHFGGRIGVENGPTVENFAWYRVGPYICGGKDAYCGRLYTDQASASRWHESAGRGQLFRAPL